jgi:hypothetical protein
MSSVSRLSPHSAHDVVDCVQLAVNSHIKTAALRSLRLRYIIEARMIVASLSSRMLG